MIGLLAVTQAVLPHFRRKLSPLILNVSSVGGRMTFPLGSLYHGTKFAVEGLSEAPHYALLPLGVRVLIIGPGMVRIDLAGRSFDFSNDPGLTEYHPLVQALMTAMPGTAAQALTPDTIVAKIFCSRDRSRRPSAVCRRT